MRFVTRRGFGFTFAAISLFVIGDVTRTGWVQVADALFWGALVVSAVVNGFSSGGISSTPRLLRSTLSAQASATVQGDDAVVEVEVHNHRPWPRFGLTLAFDLTVNDVPITQRSDDKVRLHLPFLAPSARTTIRGDLSLSRRGLYLLSDGVASSDAPFGLFRRRQRQTEESLLLVHPAPNRLVLEGVRPRPVTARVGGEIAGSRPFATGDSARQIHWRNSARVGRLMTRSYSATEQESPVLVIAPGRWADAVDAEAGLDDRCRVAAGIVDASRTRGISLSQLSALSPRLMTWNEAAAYLARLTVDGLPALREQLESLLPGSTVAVVIDATDDEAIAAIASSAPRMGAIDAWVLSDTGDEYEWRLKRTVSALRSTGVYVSVVDRPLPTVGRGDDVLKK